MASQWFPFFWGDYRRDTAMLSLAEHGAYLMLLGHFYTVREAIPAEPAEIYRICNAHGAVEQKAVDTVISRFFSKVQGGYIQKRAALEISRAEVKEKRAVTAASARWAGEQVPSSQTSMSLGDAQSMPPHPHPHPHPDPQPQPQKPKAMSGVEAQAVAIRVLAFLNEQTGRNYQAVEANTSLVVARLKDGFTEDQLRQVIVRKARKWKGDENMDQYLRPKTLFNKTNFANYAGELVAEGGR